MKKSMRIKGFNVWRSSTYGGVQCMEESNVGGVGGVQDSRSGGVAEQEIED